MFVASGPLRAYKLDISIEVRVWEWSWLRAIIYEPSWPAYAATHSYFNTKREYVLFPFLKFKKQKNIYIYKDRGLKNYTGHLFCNSGLTHSKE